MKLIPLPAFQDNYLWLLHDGQRALVVDPGDAQPVRTFLDGAGLQLEAILVTHHHPDHTGGVSALRDATGAKVWGPARETIPEPLTRLREGDRIEVLGLPFDVFDVPGHTAGHIAYYTPSMDGAPLLFCGDTLFSGGCGRLFEGTPAQMLASLDKLAALPSDTRVCCTHEYTLANLNFARAVEPENANLAEYQQQCVARRQRGEPTLPSTIGLEQRINPFLRTRTPAVQEAARAHGGADANDDVAIFAAIRQWKNEFK
jgi:hydroxyacylglutathione hydrolase